MQFEVIFLLLFGFFSSSLSAPREGLPLLSPGGIGGIFEGTNSETIIIGPDGSEITSEQKGGAVIRDDGLTSQPIIVAEELFPNEASILAEERIVSAGPITSLTRAPISVSAGQAILASQSTPLLTGETYASSANHIITGPEEIPLRTPDASILVAPEAPIIETKPIEIVQQDPHVIEIEIIEAPDVESDQSSDIKGASGRIITKGSASIVSGPASTTITEPRKIIVAPPKIAIGTPIIGSDAIPLGVPPPAISAPVQTISAAVSDVTPLSIASLPAESYEARSTLGIPILSHSSDVATLENGYSTTTTPLGSGSITDGTQSTRIDLGVNDLRESIPVVEYSSLNGVINNPDLLNVEAYSSSEAPFLSSTISTITTEQLLSLDGPAIPVGSQILPQLRQNLLPVPHAEGLASSSISTNVQRIPRIGDGIAIDGKVGELSQNEIASYDTREQFLSSPQWSQSEYIAPTLARNGNDASEVNLDSVPLSQITRLSDGAYHLESRYERNAKRKRSN